jgi:ABC-type Na+ efflux pump permease subunit
MRGALLVAAREFRQVVTTRGFWVTLLIVPIALAVSIFASVSFAPRNDVAYTIVDASGRYAPAVQHRLELNYQQQVLHDLSTYVERWKLASVDPTAMWAIKGAWASDLAVEKFIADGGEPAAWRKLQPRLPEGAPPFKLPTRYYVAVPPPAGAPVDKGPDAFGKAVAGPLQGDVVTPQGKRPFALAVYIPQDYGAPGSVARMWTNGRFDGGLGETIRQALTGSLRLQALQASGVSPQALAGIEALRAPVQVTDPPTGSGGGSRISVKSAVPLALVYLLLITAITTGSMMLQGVIEERSNKLLEAVLACVRPSSLMYGKLLGLGAVGLSIVAVWAGCAVAAAFSAPGVISDVLKPSLTAIDQPWLIAALLFYFLSGYLILSMVFLTIGSLSDSMQDAQAYLTPVILLTMLPVMFMMQATLRDPDALFTHVLSWIPLYTPFAMLARLGSGVPLAEMLGTGALLIAFVVLEILLLGRVFRASLLSAGQPASPAVFLRLMFQGGER